MAETPAGEKAEVKAETPAEEKAETKKGKPAEQVLVEKGGVLLPGGTLVFEPSIQYSNYSRHRISISGFTLFEAIVIGKIEVTDLKRDILQAALTARYGITPRFEAELKVPYLYRHDREVIPAASVSGEATARTLDDGALGDIEGALYYHLITATNIMPDIVLNVRAKSTTGQSPYNLKTEIFNGQQVFKELPTGTGHWGLSGGITAVKTSDPAVFLASLGYYWNIKRNVGYGFGTIDPGDSVEYSLTIAYALSEKVSLYSTYQQRFTVCTKQNGHKLPETYMNAATLSMGTGYAISRKSYLNLSVGVGLTVDAPDVQVALSLPFSL